MEMHASLMLMPQRLQVRIPSAGLKYTYWDK